MGENLDRGAEAFEHLLRGLSSRQATGRVVLGLELDEALASALLESGAALQQEALVSDVRLELFEDAAAFSCRLQVKGKAFPPRPPVDTTVQLSVRDVTASESGKSGSILFRVEQPLTFSSKFADMLMGIFSKLAGDLPVSPDALRHKDSLVTLDFARFVAALHPELTDRARHLRLHSLKVGTGSMRVELGFAP